MTEQEVVPHFYLACAEAIALGDRIPGEYVRMVLLDVIATGVSYLVDYQYLPDGRRDFQLSFPVSQKQYTFTISAIDAKRLRLGSISAEQYLEASGIQTPSPKPPVAKNAIESITLSADHGNVITPYPATIFAEGWRCVGGSCPTRPLVESPRVCYTCGEPYCKAKIEYPNSSYLAGI